MPEIFLLVGAMSLLAMLFSSELQYTRRLLINAFDIVLAADIDM